jgi:hypothetical protein
MARRVSCGVLEIYISFDMFLLFLPAPALMDRFNGRQAQTRGSEGR